MKKLLSLCGATAALLSFANLVSAQVIVSTQFTLYSDHNLSSSSVAGVVPAANFNLGGSNPGNNSDSHVSQLISGTGLLNSTGAATAIGYSLAFDATFQSNNATLTGPNGSNNALLLFGPYFNRYSDDTPTTLTHLSLNLTGLNASDSYDLYVYVNSPYWGSGSTSTISLVGGPSFSATSDNSLTSFTPITATNADGNYVKFAALTGATSETVTVGTSVVGLTGFQLVDNGPLSVPEPSTYALLLGGLGLMALIRRRTTVRV